MAFRDIEDPYASFDPTETAPAEPTHTVEAVQKRFGFRMETRDAVYWVTALACAFIVYFGATTAGSYFVTASRFKGLLATVFYECQVANLLTVIGLIGLYHLMFHTNKYN